MNNDTRSPESADPQQLRWLQILHEGLVRDFGAALSDLLRSRVDVSLVDIERRTYGEFLDALETPACFHVLNIVSLDDRLLLDIEPSILFPLVDRLLGGNGQDDPPLGRPLTEIELRLAARIVGLFLEEFRRVWKDVYDLALGVLQVESEPRLLRVLPSDEAVVQVDIELALGQRRGLLRLCLPCRTLERMSGREGRPAGNDAAADATVEVGITLAETPIAADQLAQLRVGDIIATETATDSPAIVSIEGHARFRAKPGVYQGRKAIRITEPIEDSSPAERK